MQYYIWIDVSKKTLDIYHSQSNQYVSINNTEKDIKSFLKWIDKEQFVIFYEATWVYSSKLIKCLNNWWFIHSQIHPNTIHFISLGMSDRNKTDKIDSYKIAQIWAVLLQNYNQNWLKCKLTVSNSNTINKLNSLMSEIYSMKKHIKILKQNIDKLKNNVFASKDTISFYEKQIQVFASQIESINKQIKLIIKEEWLEYKLENLMSIPSVWETVAIELLIFFLSLSSKWFNKQDRSKLKAYVWIDPCDKQSGSSMKSVKISKKWNKKIRSSLYIISMTWFRLSNTDKYKDSSIAQFFNRSKNKFGDERNKSTITAVSKKILLIAWWIFWNDKPFDYQHHLV